MPCDKVQGCDQISVQKSTGTRGVALFSVGFEFVMILGLGTEGATVGLYK